MKPARVIIFVLAVVAAVVAVRCGSDDATCAKDGDACTQGGVRGVCFSAVCTANACVTEKSGALGKRASGVIDPDNACQVCDPSASRSQWSKIACPTVQSACRKTAARCDPTALGGACKGEECCVYEPSWDGQGAPPSCTHGTVTGSCDAQGRCTGVCKKDADCDTKEPCRKWTCDLGTESCQSAPDDGSACDYVGTDDGVCVAGMCQKQCTQDGQCGPDGSCGENGFCVAGRADGAACASNSQCRSGNCECSSSACPSRVCAPKSTYQGARERGADVGWRFAWATDRSWLPRARRQRTR